MQKDSLIQKEDKTDAKNLDTDDSQIQKNINNDDDDADESWIQFTFEKIDDQNPRTAEYQSTLCVQLCTLLRG